MSVEKLYRAYRADIENNKPELVSLAEPLALRKDSAALYMLNRLEHAQGGNEIRGVLIVLEEMKYRRTFDPCKDKAFYVRLVRAWKRSDPNDEYGNAQGIQSLCGAR
ncbi:MAG: hypothetical protein ACJ8ER_14615 [Allosphingosinicella sp.]